MKQDADLSRANQEELRAAAEKIIANQIHPAWRNAVLHIELRLNAVISSVENLSKENLPVSIVCVSTLSVNFQMQQYQKDFALPKKIGKIFTDVVETGRFRAFAAISKERSFMRPARPGCSIGFVYTGPEA